MDNYTQDIWEFIGKIPLGTLIGWVIVLAAIVTTIVVGIKRLFKWYTVYNKYIDEKEHTAQRLKMHDEMLGAISDTLTEINTSLSEQNSLLIEVSRNNITRTCQAAIATGSITDVQLKELTELYEKYEQGGGNSYASFMMQQVKTLPIVHLMEKP